MLLAEGQRVYLVNTHVFAGLVEVRIEGETNVLWMATEAITRPADKPVRLPPRQPSDDAPAPAQIP